MKTTFMKTLKSIPALLFLYYYHNLLDMSHIPLEWKRHLRHIQPQYIAYPKTAQGFAPHGFTEFAFKGKCLFLAMNNNFY